MKERPILFSAPMVLAILDGRKTQTRRVLKPQPPSGESIKYKCGQDFSLFTDSHSPNAATFRVAGAVGLVRDACGQSVWKCPYGQPKDRLWVKETFQLCEWFQDHWEPAVLRDECQSVHKFYAADGVLPDQDCLHWRPSIFMPRWASRITLEVTAVRVERLQDISDRDADAEGTTCHYCCTEPTHEVDGIHRCDPIADYRRTWDFINAKTHPWASNPWVWVVSFKRIKP